MTKNVLTDDIGYYPSLFVILPLPYGGIKENTFIRRYGNNQITFFSPNGNIPNGKYPRSLMSLITTQYVLQKNEIKDEEQKKIIWLDNITETAKKLGVSDSSADGGKTQGEIIVAMNDLADLNIQTKSKYISDEYNLEIKKNIPLFDKSYIIWQTKKKKETRVLYPDELFKSNLTLSPQFSKLLDNHAMPIDIEVYNKFSGKNAARLQDIYVWLIKKLWYIKENTKKAEYLEWNYIIPQFFDKLYKRLDKQKSILEKDILEVIKTYPEAKIEIKKEGLILLPSRLHIDKKQIGYN